MIWSKSRIHGAVCIATLTIFSTEGDVSGLQRFARCGKAVGDLHVAGEVLLACRVRTVGELACQSIQNIRDACFVVHRDTSVVRDEGNLRAFCCTLDDGVTRFVVLCRFAISFMRIVDIRIATVVVDGQAVRILLEDVARFRFAFAANEFCQVASVVRFRTPGTLFDCAPFFVVPGCAVLQEDIDCTIEGLAAGGFTCIAKLVVCHAGPFGVCSCQTKVDVGV